LHETADVVTVSVTVLLAGPLDKKDCHSEEKDPLKESFHRSFNIAEDTTSRL
jgi:hypothetical protein